MKRKAKPQTNLSFLHGIIIAAAVFAVVLSYLSVNGSINWGANADSFKPRKNLPNWYVEPTPDPTSTDKTLPVVSIVKPTDGQIVKTNICEPLLINATDDVGVAQVTYYLNGVLDGVLMTQGVPYESCVRIPGQKGTYTLTVKAYDYSGNKAETSISLTATVK